ncbi:MAG TPA: MMPL family transporter, partial [Chitinophagaceae bacterium]|nr:MMPL family transporter [Chitinophagaceae bacterium]
MWERTAGFVLKNRVLLLIILLAATGFMGWKASKVQLSYDFSRAVPTDNPKYVSYQNFRKQFGEDGNLLAIGLQTDHFFADSFFNDYQQLNTRIRQAAGVEDVLSVTSALNLVKDSATERLRASPVFAAGPLSQSTIDSSARIFQSLLFYRGLLYNPATHTYLSAVRINKNILNSKERNGMVSHIVAIADSFSIKHGIELHYSGLPLIRTSMAIRIASEMKWFLIGSLILLALILLVFFRSMSIVLLSMAVVLIGVIWSLGTVQLLGYKITLLTALIPTLVVVIGIPNCVYFLNKYHISYNDTGDKRQALLQMISKMGVVTLFCNIAAAIGFAVFALTKSAILQEFGAVAGINIMALFFISFILIPTVLSFLPAPRTRHTKYLDNKWLLAILDRLEIWSLQHRKTIYAATAVILAIAIVGITRLRSEGFIVDDLPKTDKIYTDLKYFEKNFKGVMPLEIIIDTKQKNGLRKYAQQVYERIDSLSQFITAQPEMARPLSVAEGLKFAKQAYYSGDSNNYVMPNAYDLPFLASYLSTKADSSSPKNNLSKLLSSFIDSSKQKTRISINMADIGSKRLPELLDRVQVRADQLFDSSRYRVEFTGTSVTFLEGSAFIIHGLKDSIVYAFILISLCMLYLFRSLRILVCSLIPNVIPLVITAGIMGWAGVALKPSTVLIFSVALGIAIDITIRFLVNYKQERQATEATQEQLVVETIHTTGISIIYTSLVLIAGFVIFCFSGFGGTQALGWLTSITLVIATFTNL